MDEIIKKPNSRPTAEKQNKRCEQDLYKLALSGNVTAMIVWLTNRYPERWHWPKVN